MSFKFDLLFEVEVPQPWEPGKEASKFREAMEQAVFAERMGFDTIWVVEHHFLKEFAHSSAPEVMLGALAERTSRIRLGHGVTLMLGEVNHPIRDSLLRFHNVVPGCQASAQLRFRNDDAKRGW